MTMQVILTPQKLCKHLKEISVYICLLPKHQSFDPMSTNTVGFAKAVITSSEKNSRNEEIQN